VELNTTCDSRARTLRSCLPGRPPPPPTPPTRPRLSNRAHPARHFTFAGGERALPHAPPVRSPTLVITTSSLCTFVPPRAGQESLLRCAPAAHALCAQTRSMQDQLETPNLCTPQAEKARSEALLQRMSGLLACFPFKGGPKAGKPAAAAAAEAPAASSADGGAGADGGGADDQPLPSSGSAGGGSLRDDAMGGPTGVWEGSGGLWGGSGSMQRGPTGTGWETG
jgi:hypothetical protein